MLSSHTTVWLKGSTPYPHVLQKGYSVLILSFFLLTVRPPETLITRIDVGFQYIEDSDCNPGPDDK
jgi:hypothetical protein